MKGKRGLEGLSIVVSSLILVLSSVWPAFAEKGVTDNQILIGDMAILSGPVASATSMDSTGLRGYWQYVNESGGIHGRKIKVITEDTGYEIPKTITAWKKLIEQDKIFALAGIGTSTMLALYSKVQEEKIPFFPTSQSEKFFKPPTRYIFSLMTSYEDECRVMVDYLMEDKGLKSKKDLRLGICYNEDEMGNSLLTGVQDQLEKWGMLDKVVSKETVKRGGIDLSSQALNLKKAECNLVFGLMNSSQVGQFIRECDKLNFAPKFVTGSSGMEPFNTYRIGGKAALGLLAPSVREPWDTDAPGGVKMRALVAKIYPNLKPEQKTIYFIYGWVKGVVMAEGLRRAGMELTREKFVDALETLNNFVGDVGGLIGPVIYGPGRRSSGGSARVYELVEGKENKGDYTALTGLREPKTKAQIEKVRGK